MLKSFRHSVCVCYCPQWRSVASGTVLLQPKAPLQTRLETGPHSPRAFNSRDQLANNTETRDKRVDLCKENLPLRR